MNEGDYGRRTGHDLLNGVKCEILRDQVKISWFLHIKFQTSRKGHGVGAVGRKEIMPWHSLTRGKLYIFTYTLLSRFRSDFVDLSTGIRSVSRGFFRTTITSNIKKQYTYPLQVQTRSALTLNSTIEVNR